MVLDGDLGMRERARTRVARSGWLDGDQLSRGRGGAVGVVVNVPCRDDVAPEAEAWRVAAAKNAPKRGGRKRIARLEWSKVG